MTHGSPRCNIDLVDDQANGVETNRILESKERARAAADRLRLKAPPPRRRRPTSGAAEAHASGRQACLCLSRMLSAALCRGAAGLRLMPEWSATPSFEPEPSNPMTLNLRKVRPVRYQLMPAGIALQALGRRKRAPQGAHRGNFSTHAWHMRTASTLCPCTCLHACFI